MKLILFQVHSSAGGHKRDGKSQTITSPVTIGHEVSPHLLLIMGWLWKSQRHLRVTFNNEWNN